MFVACRRKNLNGCAPELFGDVIAPSARFYMEYVTQLKGLLGTSWGASERLLPAGKLLSFELVVEASHASALHSARSGLLPILDSYVSHICATAAAIPPRLFDF